jgi:uncharacterized RDD family membrane protein YckC
MLQDPLVPPRAALAAVAAAAPAARCVQCGQRHLASDVVNYAGAAVCAGCKPEFFQRLREGHEVLAALPYAGFWIRFLAKIIDSVLIYMAQLPLSLIVGRSPFEQPDPELMLKDPWSFWGPALVVGAIGLVISFAYNVAFVGRFAATPGKMVFGLRIVLPDGGRVSYRRALGRALAEWMTGFTCTIGYLAAAFDREKRSLHDHVAGTRVIKTREAIVTTSALECSVCNAALSEQALRAGETARCSCGESYRFVVFGAACRPPRRGEPAARRVEQEASCFFHSDNVASATCDGCGRLLCRVCEVTLEGHHRCPTCLAPAPDRAFSRALDNERWMQDSITLLIAALPPFAFWPMSPLTACYALYRTKRYYGQRQSIVPRTRVRFVLAALLAIVELGALVAIGAFLFNVWGKS